MDMNQVLEALQEAFAQNDRPDGAFSTRELADAAGISERRVREGLRHLKRNGRLETVRVRQETINGAMGTVVLYRLVA